MSTKVLDRYAYTIGWISALSVESAAAQAFLDERHDVPSEISDSNNYVMGRIGKHNVVIAVMPQNEYGTATAATTAKDMVRSFPQVRLGLMVGVGGGAPSQEHDIRLGDVVVSSCVNRTGGVIQFDYGKMIQGQDFKETRHLNQPPTSLLTAAAALNARYDIEGPQLNGKVYSALERQRKAFRKKYARPSDDTDRLYRSDIIHPEGISGECTAVCGVRSDDMVHRPPRSDDDDIPSVHYGLIASSNQVMKDASKRDELARRGVLCFEMEAAGLMNHFPCLVVRGICDYADTHKNSSWQPYASMVAAAYAKDLIELINPVIVEREKKLSELIDSVQKTLSNTKTTIDGLEYEQRLKNVKEWLRPANPSDNANHAKNLRYEKTGTWFLHSPAFIDWRNGRHRHLCLYGASGSGKTVLSSTILEFLEQDRSIIILYFFFDFGNSQKRTLDGLLRSLLFQLYTAEKGSTEKVEALRRSHEDGKRSPSTVAILQCTQDILSTLEDVVILMDGLDECKEESNEQQKLIKWIIEVGSAPDLKHVKIITTARPEATFKVWLSPMLADANWIELDKESVKTDIEVYIKGCLRERPGFHTRAPEHPIVKQISDRLIEKADGMFRYAACQIEDLVNCLGPEDIEYVLDSLPETIQETYQRSIEKITPIHYAKAIRLLQFLVNLDQPLALAAAVDVVSVRSDFRRFSSIDRICPEDITILCPNLLAVVEVKSADVCDGSRHNKYHEIHLAHLSVKEYLIQYDAPELTFAGLDARVSIVRTCLSYIHGVVAEGPFGKGADIKAWIGNDQWMVNDNWLVSEKWIGRAELEWIVTHNSTSISPRPQSFPFASLAVNIWTEQAAAAELCPKAVGAIVDHLELGFESKHRWLVPRRNQFLTGSPDDLTRSRLHFACFLGLGATTKALIGRGANVDGSESESKGMTPVEIASFMNRLESLQVLVDAGANPDTIGISHHGSALRISCEKGHLDIAKFLAKKGAVLNRLEGNDHRRQSPLQIAIANNDEALVQLLLDAGVDFDADCGDFDSALQDASWAGHTKTAAILLRHGSDLTAKGKALAYAFPAAAEEGHKGTLQLLLDYSTDINAFSNRLYGNALHAAVRRGRGDIVQLLLDKGADVFAPGGVSYGNALQSAVQLRQTAIVELILAKRAGVDSVDYSYSLQTAAKMGHKKMVRLLLNEGVIINAEDGLYGYALQAASEEGHGYIVKLLLAKGAEINAKRSTYGFNDALQAAAKAGHKRIVRILLDGGAKLNAKTGIYGYALHAAAEAGHRNMVKLLLEKGAKVNAEGGSYGHALQAAAKAGHLKMVKLLLDKGADINAQGGIFGNALYAAASEGFQSLVEVLVERGAHVNAQGGPYGNALTVACVREFPETMNYLLEKGAHPNTPVPGLGNTLQVFMRRTLDWNVKNDSILTSLLNAKAVLPQCDDGFSQTALRLAVRDGNLEHTRLLLSEGVDPDILFFASDMHNHNLLMESLCQSHPNIAAALLRFGANPHAKTSRRGPEKTALRLALEEDFEDVVLLLLRRGADPNGLDSSPSFNPLQHSIIRGSVKYVRLLLEYGAGIVTVGEHDEDINAVQLAEERGNEDILQLLAQLTITRRKKKKKRKNGKQRQKAVDDTTENPPNAQELQRRGA